MQRTRHGFTLVELLVVITIIGILIALIIPAVNAVREQGRQTTCMNNQREIAKSILGYELAKRQLPGVMAQIPGGAQYCWAEAIFPYMDRGDLWDKVRANQVSAISTMRVDLLICPDDPLTINPTAAVAQALLSYGVNDQFFTDNRPLSNSPPTLPVDRNNNKVGQAVVSNLMTRPTFPNPSGATSPHGWSVTTSQTIMLGDRTFNDSAGFRATKWTDASWTSLAFPWPSSPTPITPGIMGSTHGSTMITPSSTGTKTAVGGTIVVITYFDGHSEKIASDTKYPL